MDVYKFPALLLLSPFLDKRLVHAGFRRAFRSIRGAVLQAIAFIAPDLTGWTIDCTGHSLGVSIYTPLHLSCENNSILFLYLLGRNVYSTTGGLGSFDGI